MKKVYFSHSKKIYNSPEEKEYIATIAKFFPAPGWHVINPAELKFAPAADTVLPYLDVVRKSDILIVSEYMHCLGRGAFREVKTAIRSKIPIFLIRNTKHGHRLFKIKTVIVKDPNDFVTYAKIAATEAL